MAEFAGLRALAFGASMGLAIGPIALLIVSVGLHRGLRRAAACALGAAAADFTYALVALAAGAQLERWLLAQRTLFELSSAALLLALGVHLGVSALRRSAPGAAPANPDRSIGFGSTYLLTLANPLTILLFASFSGQLPLAGAASATLAYALLIFLGSLPLQLAYAALGSTLHSSLSPTWVRRANLASALAIAGFGVYGIWRVL